MEGKRSPLPMISVVAVGVSLLPIPIGMSRTWPHDVFHSFFLLALVVALTSVVLGIAGIVKTRGEELGRRVPAFMATGLGCTLSLGYGLVYWLSTPF